MTMVPDGIPSSPSVISVFPALESPVFTAIIFTAASPFSQKYIPGFLILQWLRLEEHWPQCFVLRCLPLQTFPVKDFWAAS